jgi:hypothetical protein
MVFAKMRRNPVKGDTMNRHQLTEVQEREAELLEAKIRLAIDQEIAALARVLVSKSESELFGATEFEIRELVLRIGAAAFGEHVRGKKTAIEAVRYLAPAAGRAPTFKAIVPCSRSAFWGLSRCSAPTITATVAAANFLGTRPWD